MKAILLGVFTLISIQIQAQLMKTPEQAVTQLFIATDNKDWNQVEEIFDNKVVLDYSSMTGSPAAELTPQQITGAWKSVLPGFEYTHHQLGNFISTTDGSTAEVFCYGTATHYLTHEKGNVWTVVGTYNFELNQDAKGNWHVASMKFNFKYQDGNLSLPQEAMNKLK